MNTNLLRLTRPLTVLRPLRSLRPLRLSVTQEGRVKTERNAGGAYKAERNAGGACKNGDERRMDFEEGIKTG